MALTISTFSFDIAYSRSPPMSVRSSVRWSKSKVSILSNHVDDPPDNLDVLLRHPTSIAARRGRLVSAAATRVAE
jgi:hypothetical protein